MVQVIWDISAIAYVSMNVTTHLVHSPIITEQGTWSLTPAAISYGAPITSTDRAPTYSASRPVQPGLGTHLCRSTHRHHARTFR